MPIYEYICDDCGEHYERIVMSGSTKIDVPEVREREEHDSAFGVCGARQRNEGVGRLVACRIRLGRRLLRRRLRLPLGNDARMPRPRLIRKTHLQRFTFTCNL